MMASNEAGGFFDEIEPARVRSAKIRHFHQAWDSMRPAPGVLPGRAHFDPTAVGSLLPSLISLDILRQGDGRVSSFRFRLVGSAISEAYGEDPTGKIVGVDGSLDGTLGHHRLAAESGRAVWRLAPPSQPVLKGRVQEVENLVLPLARDGRAPDVLMMLAVFYDHAGREFRPFRRRSGPA